MAVGNELHLSQHCQHPGNRKNAGYDTACCCQHCQNNREPDCIFAQGRPCGRGKRVISCFDDFLKCQVTCYGKTHQRINHNTKSDGDHDGSAHVIEFIEETTSGKTPIKDRQLQQVIDSMALGDTLIVSKLSRLGRNMVEVMSVLDMLIKKGCKVHAVKGGHRLDQSLSSKIVSMVLLLGMVLLMAAEIERELISQRT